VGKWHLGMNPEFHPRRRGFDEFFGFLAGGHPYFPGGGGKNNPIQRGTRQVEEQRYLTTAFGQEAAAFVRRWKDKPFFLYLPFNAPHKPMQAPQRYLDRFAGIADPKRRKYAAMVAAMDDAVGEVLRAVRETGLGKDTLVIFLSDNGGATQANGADNRPFRAHKGALYEGGVRVPFMMQWKGRLQANRVVQDPVSALDIYPTALAAAGVRAPGATELDGINLLPHLVRGGAGKPVPQRPLFWRLGQRSAMRHGRWKLVQRRVRPAELYDLTVDKGERNDLAAAKPGVVKQLQATMTSWQGMMSSARWQPQAPRREGMGGGKRRRKGRGMRRRKRL
jgi:arylsulfatase A-like enzyme